MKQHSRSLFLSMLDSPTSPAPKELFLQEEEAVLRIVLQGDDMCGCDDIVYMWWYCVHVMILCGCDEWWVPITHIRLPGLKIARFRSHGSIRSWQLSAWHGCCHCVGRERGRRDHGGKGAVWGDSGVIRWRVYDIRVGIDWFRTGRGGFWRVRICFRLELHFRFSKIDKMSIYIYRGFIKIHSILEAIFEIRNHARSLIWIKVAKQTDVSNINKHQNLPFFWKQKRNY